MAVRYACTVPDCGWQHEGGRKTAAQDIETVDVHRASHVDPLAQGVLTLPDTVTTRTHHGWLVPLAVLNGIFFAIALVGGIGGEDFNAVGLVFPQIWGWQLPFGAGIGILSVLTIVISTVAAGSQGSDGADRRYRAFSATTLSSFIMFMTCASFTIVVFALLSGVNL